jgi:hypothetical protein
VNPVESVQSNPVTTVAAVGLVIQGIAHFVGWDEETQLVLAQGTLGAAVLIRAALAWWEARKAK